GALAVPMLEEIVGHHARRAPHRSRAEIVAEALRRFIVADVDAGALETAVFRLRMAALRLSLPSLEAQGLEAAPPGPRTFHGDTLTAEPTAVAAEGVDIVLMNPPYLGARYFEALPHPESAR